jgi:hypothetical protein
MAKKFIWLIAAVLLLAFQTSPASACKVVRYSSDGEPLCATTSDGKGQQYTDDRPNWSARDRWLTRLRHRRALEQQATRPIKHSGWGW